jgi:hypothetical protein
MNLRCTIWVLGFVLLALNAEAQRTFNITPFIGLNTTRMNLYDYTYSISQFTSGGNYALVGVEVEAQLHQNKRGRLRLTSVTGCSYLANGYKDEGSFALGSISYTYHETDLDMKYLQAPLLLRVKWQPFPLIENFHLFAGAGVSASFLQKATISEKGIYYFISSDVMNPPPATEFYEDHADVTHLGRQLSWFRRSEIGIVVNRVQLSFRMSRALQDMYFTGLENDWAVPANRSRYLDGRTINGKIYEQYREITVGFRLF